MALAASTSSLGCYALCGRLLHLPPPPPHACSRGLSLEGLGSVLAGLLGSPMGTASSFPNVGKVGLIQVCGPGMGVGWGGARGEGEGRELIPIRLPGAPSTSHQLSHLGRCLRLDFGLREWGSERITMELLCMRHSTKAGAKNQSHKVLLSWDFIEGDADS